MRHGKRQTRECPQHHVSGENRAASRITKDNDPFDPPIQRE